MHDHGPHLRASNDLGAAPPASDRLALGHPRLLLALTIVLLAFLAALFLAATASAETLVGEATSPVDAGITGEADILSAKLIYESTAGSVTYAVTTREAPDTADEDLQLDTLLGTGEVCNERPLIGMVSWYDEPEPEAEWEAEAVEGVPATSGPVTKTVSGDTTNLSATDASLAAHPYSCAIVVTILASVNGEGEEQETVLDSVKVPLGAAQTTPPPVTPPAPTPAVPAAPAPTPAAPAALSIGKLKPLKLKVGKWAKVKVEVSDTGGSATSPGGLKVKAPKGVLLKPASGKLTLAPLQPGETKTASFKVKLTEKAKAKSTLALAGTAASLTAKGSVVVKLAG